MCITSCRFHAVNRPDVLSVNRFDSWHCNQPGWNAQQIPNTKKCFPICESKVFARCQGISLKSSSGRCLKGWNEASDLFVSVVEALGNQDALRGYDESAEILLARPACIIQRAGGCLCFCIWLNYYYPVEFDLSFDNWSFSTEILNLFWLKTIKMKPRLLANLRQISLLEVEKRIIYLFQIHVIIRFTTVNKKSIETTVRVSSPASSSVRLYLCATC